MQLIILNVSCKKNYLNPDNPKWFLHMIVIANFTMTCELHDIYAASLYS